MKYIDEFRRGGAVRKLTEDIQREAADRSLTFMEVCGTHTMAIARSGIQGLLPDGVSLISGPGCPVCVTPNHTVDHAISLSREKGVIITTFGDMMKVPGSSSSLDREHALGGDIRVVASTLDALEIAKTHRDKEIVFLGVGFETTTPTVAAAVVQAMEKQIDNFSVLSAHKLIPPAMRALTAGEVEIDGFICPGHVSAIIGSAPYAFIAEECGIACVITGFEPMDILQGISMLVRQIRDGNPRVEIQYTRVVRPEGNTKARAVVESVFEMCDSEWRGIGRIPESGLKMRGVFAARDAGKKIPVEVEPAREPEGCLCGLVLQGRAKPLDCEHFGSRCTPEDPVGPCMVSTEGTCAAYYRYGSGR